MAVVAVGVAVATLRDSRAGQRVEADDRVVAQFPPTPTVGVAVVDAESRLTALAIATLSPDGVGGSLVTLPVNVDTTLGFGRRRTPLNTQPYTPDDPDSEQRLANELESVLAITLTDTVIVGRDRLAELVAPFAPLTVEFADDVVGAGGADGEVVAEAGRQILEAADVADVLTSIDVDGDSSTRHAADVVVWSALADAVSDAPLDAEAALDEFGRPVAPPSTEAFLDRLFSGSVGARDLTIDPEATAEARGPDGADFVIVDSRDTLLVFAEIAPALVSTPNESFTFQVIAPFSDQQIESFDPDATTAGLVRDLIGELLFADGNVVSVQTTASMEGAGSTTRLEVADAALIDTVRDVAPVLFGDVDVTAATRLIDTVDVVAILGTDFLDRRAEIVADDEEDDAGEGSRDGNADANADGAVDGEAADAVVDAEQAALDRGEGGEGAAGEEGGGGPAVGADGEPVDGDGAASDTVDDDE